MLELTADEQVRAALSQAVAPVRTSPSLLPDVHRQIRRTVIHRRVRRAAGTGVAIAVLAVSVVMLRTGQVRQSAPVPLAERYQVMLERPTGGDLSTNTTYQDKVLSVYSTWVNGPAEWSYQDGPGGRLTGEPNLAWVGSTPNGPAGIVVQEVQPPISTAPKGPPHNAGLYVAYIGSYPDGMQVSGDGTIGAEQHSIGGALVGQNQGVLLSLDVGGGMSYSTAGTTEQNGHIVRQYTPVQYTTGAAVVQLPAGVDADWVTMRSADPDYDFYVSHQPDGRSTGREVLPWEGVYPLTAGGAVPDQDVLQRRFEDALRRADYTDPNHWDVGLGHWYAYGTLPDGTEILVGQYELLFDNVPRTYAVLFPPGKAAQVVFGGVADRSVLVPVQIRLPGHRGWVLVRPAAALSWRPHAAGVTAVSGSARGAALLPANIRLDVEVVLPLRESPGHLTLEAA